MFRARRGQKELPKIDADTVVSEDIVKQFMEAVLKELSAARKLSESLQQVEPRTASLDNTSKKLDDSIETVNESYEELGKVQADFASLNQQELRKLCTTATTRVTLLKSAVGMAATFKTKKRTLKLRLYVCGIVCRESIKV